jgi:dTDP-4-dehydrorhamnose 3,5-epimerase
VNLPSLHQRYIIGYLVNQPCFVLQKVTSGCPIVTVLSGRAAKICTPAGSNSARSGRHTDIQAKTSPTRTRITGRKQRLAPDRAYTKTSKYMEKHNVSLAARKSALPLWMHALGQSAPPSELSNVQRRSELEDPLPSRADFVGRSIAHLRRVASKTLVCHGCDARPGGIAGRKLIFRATNLKGVFVIELEKREDDRGFFARSFCREEFQAHGLNLNVAQCNVSFNRKKGTLRGMHFQTAPYEEAKLVRCTRGSMYDVCIDLRTNSPTFKQHFAVVLSAHEHNMIYIPEGFAHGLQTLEDDTEVFYQMSQMYSPESARGVRWNDPAFCIEWPPAERTMTEKDRTYPDFAE